MPFRHTDMHTALGGCLSLFRYGRLTCVCSNSVVADLYTAYTEHARHYVPERLTNKPWLSIRFLAGIVGIEPTHNRVKVCCLTSWRNPYIHGRCFYPRIKNIAYHLRHPWNQQQDLNLQRTDYRSAILPIELCWHSWQYFFGCPFTSIDTYHHHLPDKGIEPCASLTCLTIGYRLVRITTTYLGISRCKCTTTVIHPRSLSRFYD